MFETKARKGLEGGKREQSVPRRTAANHTHYKAVRGGLVDTEAVMKAGHVVEPERDMQSCAKPIESDDASSASSNGFFMAPVCLILTFVLVVDLLFLTAYHSLLAVQSSTVPTVLQNPQREPYSS